MSPRWDEIWAQRRLPPPAAGGSLLRRLMDADGLDSGFAHVSEAAWLHMIARLASAWDLAPHESVFDVGCGAGAFLLPFHDAGHPVGGIDGSPGLVAAARQVGLTSVSVAWANGLDPLQRSDVVASFGVFIYFDSWTYAERVLDRMVAKARRVVAVLDIPDAARQGEALAQRQRLAGGAAAYAARYDGLEHRYFDRRWFADALTARGLTDVHVEDQSLDGYGNAPFRFNAWGIKPGSGRRL
jgi:SAM-dependent methyltransferase